MQPGVIEYGSRADSAVPNGAPILLVEDSLPDAMVAKRALDLGGASHVEHCSTLSAAIERLADTSQESPGAVLLDLTLPDSSGIETFDRINEIGSFPVVILSAEGDPQRALELIERGAQDFLVKSQVSPEVLSRAVAQAIERGRLLERQEAKNDRALAAVRVQNAFIAAMSHEIRTPLSAILGMSELLAGTDLSLDQREYVEVSRRCGRALRVLLDNLLETARLDDGNLRLAEEPFAFDSLLEECLELFSNAAHQKGLTLVADFSEDVVGTATGDEGRLRQVLFNLLGNSVKFTESGRIVLRARAGENGEGVVVEVSDTGIGIPRDRQAAVFERFVQAESGTTRRFGGSGLGLSLCRDLVNAMGGRIELESVEGEGSLFRCILPLHVELREPSTRLTDRRILAVIADPVERETTAARLRQNGAWVCAVSSVRDVEVQLEADHFDAILADVRSPEGCILELFERLNRAGSLPHRVALLPMNHRAGDQSSLNAMGAIALRKPAPFDDLLQALKDGRIQRPDAIHVPIPNLLGHRILVVDDAPEMRAIADAHLRATQCSVEMAFDGRLAVEKARSILPDLILMDSQMPDLDGLEATRRIRAAEEREGRPATPIIALTADAQPNQKAAFFEAGCDAYLLKPFTREELYEVVQRFLSPVQTSSSPELAAFEPPDTPPELADLVEGYLERRRGDAAVLLDAARAKSFGVARDLGHRIKGSGAGYGFAPITEIGARIERAAIAKNALEIEHCAIALLEYVQMVSQMQGQQLH